MKHLSPKFHIKRCPKPQTLPPIWWSMQKYAIPRNYIRSNIIPPFHRSVILAKHGEREREREAEREVGYRPSSLERPWDPWMRRMRSEGRRGPWRDQGRRERRERRRRRRRGGEEEGDERVGTKLAVATTTPFSLREKARALPFVPDRARFALPTRFESALRHRTDLTGSVYKSGLSPNQFDENKHQKR